jgi:hypothetical protein
VRAALTVVFAVQPVVGGFLPASDCSSSGASTKIESARVSLVPLPFAWTLKLNVPLCVGVPGDDAVRGERQTRRERAASERPRVHVSPGGLQAGAVYAWPSSRPGGSGRDDEPLAPRR